MAKRSGSHRTGTWLVVLISVAFAAMVIYRSFHVAGFQCDVCISFAGNSACRTVDGPTEREAQQAAINNTCAQLASGVTDSMACERTAPTKLECRSLN